MQVGRPAERGRLDGLLEDARRSVSGVLVLTPVSRGILARRQKTSPKLTAEVRARFQRR